MVRLASSLTSSISSSVEEDVFALLDLVALDDVVGVDRADARHDLLVADALAARLVDLVEEIRVAAWSPEDLDRDGNERQPDLAGPIGARRP